MAASVLSGYAADLSEMRLRVGLIGAGWYGKTDLLRLIQMAPVEVVAIAEPDSRMAAGAAEIIASRQLSKKKPRVFADYRKMLANEEFDAMVIGTPDHWHALPTIEAIQAGCDVYVQKPTSVDVVESQAMLAAARKHGKVVQVGMQRRSTPHLVDAIEQVVADGRLGEVRHAEGCCYFHMRNRTPAGEAAAEVPDHLDWDLWTGPAPLREYNSVVHPRGWRAFQEYGNGIMGDMCVHMLDAIRWTLDLGWPERISSSGGIYVDKDSIANIPDTQSAIFDFGDLSVTWQHRSWGRPVDPRYPWAYFIYGDKGTLKASVNRWEFFPTGSDKPALSGLPLVDAEKYPEEHDEDRYDKEGFPAIRAHMVDWLEAIASRGKPVADIEQGHISTASCILANHSMELGRTLHWDAEAGRVKGDDEANALLARDYREGYEHPDPKRV